MGKRSVVMQVGTEAIVESGRIESLIVEIRGQQVMLDRDLASLYGVETKRLNEQVRRNIERFPEDFMFQLTKEEAEFIKSTHTNIFIDENRSRSQIATLKIFVLICFRRTGQ